jgi:hypothetical protein
MKSMLTSVQIILPSNTFKNLSSFIELFDNTNKLDNKIEFITTPCGYFPQISLVFSENVVKPQVNFYHDTTRFLSVNLQNETGKIWKSRYKYKHITIEELKSRLHKHEISFLYYDHLGINIPSLGKQNFQLDKINKLLSRISLLHSFPGNNDWEFIIPGTESEILSKIPIDYNIERKPKFELVNFTTCSTPLIQIELATNAKYEMIKELFPEAIHVEEVKNSWVYLENSTDIDICLVFNEVSEGWTSFFADSRVYS